MGANNRLMNSQSLRQTSRAQALDLLKLFNNAAAFEKKGGGQLLKLIKDKSARLEISFCLDAERWINCSGYAPVLFDCTFNANQLKPLPGLVTVLSFKARTICNSVGVFHHAPPPNKDINF